ncbi:hypothetical protein [Sporisorium scitamineum]|uniref:Uncharacterized protein n=1 Tax=Sporisorium scitamineum TaxID=49012 RepID=A0A0F7RTT8_9BASI|nr:hypothetical protein [Sporisorium scitamineum]
MDVAPFPCESSVLIFNSSNKDGKGKENTLPFVWDRGTKHLLHMADTGEGASKPLHHLCTVIITV